MNIFCTFLFKTARYLMIVLTACIGLLCLCGNAAAQCDYSSIFSSNSSNTASLPFDIYNDGMAVNYLPPPSATNSITFNPNSLVDDSSLATDNTTAIKQPFFIAKGTALTLENNGILAAKAIYLDGKLNIENGGHLGERTILFVSPNGVLDLRGATFTISALIFADGTRLSCQSLSPVDQDQSTETNSFTISSVSLSNGGLIINGTLIIDPTQTDAPVIDERPETVSNLFSSLMP